MENEEIGYRLEDIANRYESVAPQIMSEEIVYHKINTMAQPGYNERDMGGASYQSKSNAVCGYPCINF